MSTNIENYLILAQNALDGNNYVECDNYVNKVLEIDSVNTDAYLLKIKGLLVKQRYGYNEDEHKIHKHKFIDNIEKQKSSCYSAMINNCELLEKHTQSIMDFVMDDFFGEEYSFMSQKIHNKFTSIDLLVHTLRKVSNSTDDKIIESFLMLYEKAKQDDETKAKIFLKSCIVNYKYELTEKEIGEKFYRELIKIKIYDILYNSPEINYTVKEMIEDINCINDIDLDEYELSDIKKEIHSINNLIENVKIYNPYYDIYDDEIVELTKILKFWIDGDYKEEAISVYNKIKKINANYTIDGNLESKIKSFQNTNKQGCYIATCVYGSYDCPQVWVLRRFRDYTLDKTLYGRLFIKTYYTISPKLVKSFGNTKWFKKCWKCLLDSMVSKLRFKGYTDTKYIDKY